MYTNASWRCQRLQYIPNARRAPGTDDYSQTEWVMLHIFASGSGVAKTTQVYINLGEPTKGNIVREVTVARGDDAPLVLLDDYTPERDGTTVGAHLHESMQGVNLELYQVRGVSMKRTAGQRTPVLLRVAGAFVPFSRLRSMPTNSHVAVPLYSIFASDFSKDTTAVGGHGKKYCSVILDHSSFASTWKERAPVQNTVLDSVSAMTYKDVRRINAESSLMYTQQLKKYVIPTQRPESVLERLIKGVTLPEDSLPMREKYVEQLRRVYSEGGTFVEPFLTILSRLEMDPINTPACTAPNLLMVLRARVGQLLTPEVVADLMAFSIAEIFEFASDPAETNSEGSDRVEIYATREVRTFLMAAETQLGPLAHGDAVAPLFHLCCAAVARACTVVPTSLEYISDLTGRKSSESIELITESLTDGVFALGDDCDGLATVACCIMHSMATMRTIAADPDDHAGRLVHAASRIAQLYVAGLLAGLSSHAEASGETGADDHHGHAHATYTGVRWFERDHGSQIPVRRHAWKQSYMEFVSKHPDKVSGHSWSMALPRPMFADLVQHGGLDTSIGTPYGEWTKHLHAYVMEGTASIFPGLRPYADYLTGSGDWETSTPAPVVQQLGEMHARAARNIRARARAVEILNTRIQSRGESMNRVFSKLMVNKAEGGYNPDTATGPISRFYGAASLFITADSIESGMDCGTFFWGFHDASAAKPVRRLGAFIEEILYYTEHGAADSMHLCLSPVLRLNDERLNAVLAASSTVAPVPPLLPSHLHGAARLLSLGALGKVTPSTHFGTGGFFDTRDDGQIVTVRLITRRSYIESSGGSAESLARDVLFVATGAESGTEAHTPVEILSWPLFDRYPEVVLLTVRMRVTAHRNYVE